MQRAVAVRPEGERAAGRRPRLVLDDDHLARADLADELGVDQVERAGLGGDEPGVAEPADRQRPEALRVTRRQDLLPCEDDDRVGAAYAPERVEERLDAGSPPSSGRPGEGGPRCRSVDEDRPLRLELGAELVAVDEVAVVGDRQRPLVRVVDDRLRVVEQRAAGGRVADVADGRPSRQTQRGAPRRRCRRRSPSRARTRSRFPFQGGDPCPPPAPGAAAHRARGRSGWRRRCDRRSRRHRTPRGTRPFRSPLAVRSRAGVYPPGRTPPRARKWSLRRVARDQTQASCTVLNGARAAASRTASS